MTPRLTRQQLQQFLTDPRTIRTFEQLFVDVQETLPDSVESLAMSLATTSPVAPPSVGETCAPSSVDLGPAFDDLNKRLEALEMLPPTLPASDSGTPAPPSGVLSGAFVLSLPAVGGGVYEHEQTVAITGVTGGMYVFLAIAPHADVDENNEMMLSLITISGEAGAGTITARLSFSELTSGDIRVNYMAVT